MELLFNGKVLNMEAVQNRIGGSPAIFRDEILSWLLKENTAFIGSKTRPGEMRQKLYSKRRWSDSGTWRKQVVNLVNGKEIGRASCRERVCTTV